MKTPSKKKKKRRYNSAIRWKRNFAEVSFEPVIKPLYRYFIEPCIKHFTLTEDQTRIHALRMWFGTAQVQITCYSVLRGFKMPGQIRDEDSNMLKKPLYTKTVKGNQFWVRFDQKTPNRVEVEVDHLNQVFIMTMSEWNRIRENLEYVG
jgi:hypothetical protein